jgi:signal transduction histidine kinase
MASRLRLALGNPWAFDIALTVLLLAVGAVALFTYRPDDGVEYRDPDVLGVVLIAAFTVPVLFRRVAPLPVALVLAALNLAATVWHYPAPTGAVVMLIAVYSLGAYTGLAPGLAGLASILSSTYLYLIVTARRFPEADDLGGAALVFVTLGFAGAWGIGRSVRAPRLHAQHLEERAEQLERTREAEVRAALAEERGQIARELHDVVAHHVSVMTVQAAGARRSLDRDPVRSREALVAIEATGRAALAEMRRMVGVLRGPNDEHPRAVAGRTPQPGLADLPTLVDQLAATGLPVTLRTEGDRAELPISVDLTAYRIVQEALTNTLKHATGATAAVTLRYSPTELIVEVTDNGRGRSQDSGGRRPGHGLLGMRERVALYGGDLHAGPAPAGGFQIRARIPVQDGS